MSENADREWEAFDRAMDLAVRGEHQVATAILRDLAGTGNPVGYWSRINLGILLRNQGDSQGATAAFADVQEHSDDPELRANAAFQLGESLTLAGETDGAVRAWRVAIQSTDPDFSARARVNLATALVQKGLYGEAVLELQSARLTNDREIRAAASANLALIRTWEGQGTSAFGLYASARAYLVDQGVAWVSALDRILDAGAASKLTVNAATITGPPLYGPARPDASRIESSPLQFEAGETYDRRSIVGVFGGSPAARIVVSELLPALLLFTRVAVGQAPPDDESPDGSFLFWGQGRGNQRLAGANASLAEVSPGNTIFLFRSLGRYRARALGEWGLADWEVVPQVPDPDGVLRQAILFRLSPK
jgi:hypothetical protein